MVMYAPSAHPVESWNGCVISPTVFTKHMRYPVLCAANKHQFSKEAPACFSTVMTSTWGVRLFPQSVGTHTVLGSIMQIWWYIMLLVITTTTQNLSLWLKMIFFFSVFVFHLLYPPVVILIFLLHYTIFPASPSSFPPPPPPPLFIHCHLFTHFTSLPPSTSSWALYLLLSSPCAFLHNVFLLSSPVTTCVCHAHFLHELAWHLFISLLPQPLTLIIAVFH